MPFSQDTSVMSGALEVNESVLYAFDLSLLQTLLIIFVHFGNFSIERSVVTKL